MLSTGIWWWTCYLADQFHDIEDLKPKERAGMRWRGMEAFNCAPGLSPMARRVGAALMYATNAETLLCCPSELFIAAALSVNLTSVKNAKAELGPRTQRSLGKDKGHEWIGAELINWHHPRGPMSSCNYSFNWRKLMALAADAKKRAETAVDDRRAERRKGSQTTTYVGSETATSNLAKASSLGSDSENQGSHPGSLGSQTATLKVATPLPEPPMDISNIEVAQQNTHSQANGGLAEAEDSEKLFLSQSAAQLTEPRRALEGRKKEPPKPLVFFDALVNVLGKDDPKVTVAVTRLGFEQQKEASRLMTMESHEAALAYIRENDPKGMAA